MKTELIEKIELDLLLEAIFKRYGYDFRGYATMSIYRRVKQFIISEQVASISDLLKLILYDKELALYLIQHFFINVSEMFRNPSVYQSLLKYVIPLLRTYPSFKVWHAGCADGQEVYSFAILLKEAGILDRATIFATDINIEALNTAKNGIYPIRDIQAACSRYHEAGGQSTLTDYCHAAYDSISMNSDLIKRITFAKHNLVQNTSFNKMHLILCRNVLIYFNYELKGRALDLFTNSLVNGGYICLGAAEKLLHSRITKDYEWVDRSSSLYRKQVTSSWAR